jgi:hypothetical protein
MVALEPGGVGMLLEQLVDLSGFGKVYSVTPKYSAAVAESDRVAAIRDIFNSNLAVFWRERWKADRFDASIEDRYGNQQLHTLTCGSWRRDGQYFAFIDATFPQPLGQDKLYRKALFERALGSIGLAGDFAFDIKENNALRISALHHRKLINMSAEPSGANPRGIGLHDFHNVEETTQAWQGMIQGIDAHITHGMIAADIPMPWYNDLYPRLNELARGWNLQIISEMDGPAALPIEDYGLIERGPGYYPLIRWFDRDYDVAILGAAIVEDGQCRLELACEDSSADVLMARATILKDIHFEVILP